MRTSLAKLIDGSPGYRCVSQHASGENALQEIPKIKPDVTLMDINLPGINGVECVRRLKPLLPATQIIMLTVYQNTENIFNALAAGATGYLLKQTPPAELLAAIQRRACRRFAHEQPHRAQNRAILPAAGRRRRRRSKASRPARRRCWICWRKGYLYKEIAEKMQVTYATVHTHIRHIYEKLHVRSRTEAVAKHLGQTRPRHEPVGVP